MGKKITSHEQKEQIEKEIKKLVRDLNNEKNSAKKKSIRKELKKLNSQLVNMRRIIFTSSRSRKKDIVEKRKVEAYIEKQNEQERLRLIQQDIKNRKERSFVSSNDITRDKSHLVCPSCNTPYNNSSGFQRCKCS
ncbi:hypothetical protein [Fictibacillus halophilus]|uniref:hypothetical protein n=1 Tax=Fictibacillus halophilus TaxID=1610490 RepID=UPI001CFB1DAD|nr:hypothetical protein [Fictibacillus halophilus]